MSSELEIIKTAAPFAASFVPSIVEIFVKPKLQKLSKFLKKNKVSSLISVEAKFAEYLTRSYEKYSFIPILIFQNQQKRLADIYVPLTVRKERENEAFLIDDYPKTFLPRYKKVLIRDTAGMGKSTLMKRLFLSCLEDEQGIPVFIELRRLKGDDSIAGFVHRELNPINDEFDQEFILNLIKEGNFIFFLDGFDEIAPGERERVTQNLHDFIAKTGDNLFIMTSRPETSLASFPDFMEFDIQPLKPEEAFALLRRYDKKSKLSAEIIAKLEGETLRSVKEFLTNPLLVSLLYKSYDYKRTIPLKKHNFYRQVYDALFQDHDLTKEGWAVRDKRSGLDVDNFHAVLRALGIITIRRGIEYEKDEILAFIKEAKRLCSVIEFRESRFLEDLLQSVPLFSKEGNHFRWSHKSLQDYFAAQFIWLDTGEKKPEVLRKIARSGDNEKYENVLDLYYEMDYKAFRQVIIYDYLAEFLTHYDSPITIQTEEDIAPDAIKLAKLLTFDSSYVFLPRSGIFRSPFNKLLENITGYLQSKYHLKIKDNLKAVEENGLVHYTNYNYLLTTILNNKKASVFQKKEKAFAVPHFEPPEGVIFLGSNLIINNQMNTHPWPSGQTVTASLIRYLHKRPFKSVLNVKACRQLKAEIEAEISKEKSSDLFDDL